jgi:hypothetical protein
MPQGESRRVAAFIHVSLDGYYCDQHGDMSFAHKPPDDTEWSGMRRADEGRQEDVCIAACCRRRAGN